MSETNTEIIDRMVEEEIGNNPKLKPQLNAIKAIVREKLANVDLINMDEDGREDAIANALTPYTASS